MRLSDRWLWIIIAVFVVFSGAAASWHYMRQDQLDAEMLTLYPNDVPNHPDLVRFAAQQARPLYTEHCSSCHGADMKGNVGRGGPNLSDGVWLYGNGTVFDIERTILYGIRSGRSRAHDVTAMTAFGLRGILTPTQIRNVVQYVLKLSGRPYLAEAADEGDTVFHGKAACADCHGSDARGDSNYGAPDLTINVWNNGGDPASLYHSIYYGLQRMCPGWFGIIPLEKIRALAVYIYSVSHSRTKTTVALREGRRITQEGGNGSDQD